MSSFPTSSRISGAETRDSFPEILERLLVFFLWKNIYYQKSISMGPKKKTSLEIPSEAAGGPSQPKKKRMQPTKKKVAEKPAPRRRRLSNILEPEAESRPRLTTNMRQATREMEEDDAMELPPGQPPTEPLPPPPGSPLPAEQSRPPRAGRLTTGPPAPPQSPLPTGQSQPAMTRPLSPEPLPGTSRQEGVAAQQQPGFFGTGRQPMEVDSEDDSEVDDEANYEDDIPPVDIGVRNSRSIDLNKAGPRANSTVRRSNANLNLNSNAQASDPVARIADALSETLRNLRETSINEGSVRLMNRLTTAKLPTFSGDPLEWAHFKDSYELTTELGGFSDRDNVARLFEALKGDARESVGTLLATSRDAAAIMQTLQLHFGNSKVIAKKISAEIKDLPALGSGKITLIQFATKIKNAVAAFNGLKMQGYLHSPELINSISEKLPSVLKYAYNKYAFECTENKSELQMLGDFLYLEAERSIAGGMLDFATGDNVREKAPKRAPAKSVRVFAIEAEERLEPKPVAEKPASGCVVCHRDNHDVAHCVTFARETVERRWFLARKFKLCFKCLKHGHAQNDCKGANCPHCKRRHNVLLHTPRHVQKESGKSSPPRREARAQQTSGQSNKSAKD